MNKIIIMALLCLTGTVYGQGKIYFRADSSQFERSGGNNELIILNGTRGVTGGVLTNTGNGRTAFVTPGAFSGWGLTGNAGINDATNFVGPTNATDLAFRANNLEVMRLDQNYYNISIGYLALPSTNTPTASVPNISIGTQSMRNATTAYGNVAIGNESLNTLSTQQGNIAMGHQSGNQVTGIYGTYLGTHSGQNNTTGNYNVGVGYYSVFAAAGGENSGLGTRTLQASGIGNTSVGFWAMNGNGTGGAGTGGFLANYNTAVGWEAGKTIGANTYNVLLGASTKASDGLTNAGAIGALASVTQANSISIGAINGTNGAISNTNVGIGKTNPSEILDVVGNVRFSGALMPNNTAGTTGQVLTSAGAGVVPTWQTPSSGGITVGTTAIASGTPGRILFEGAGNVLQQDGSLFWDNTNDRLGVGTASPSAPLHVAGASSGVNAQFSPTGAAVGYTIGNLSNYAGNEIGLYTTAGSSMLVFEPTPAKLHISSLITADVGNGYVGIGTGSPASALHIGASGAILTIGGGATAGELKFLEPSGSGSNYSTFKAVAQASNINYSLPAADVAGVLTSNGSGALSWNGLPTLASGTYTPTGTNDVNLTSHTEFTCQYLRVGNTVTVSGKITLRAALPATITSLDLDLPVSSTFGDEENAGGTGWSPAIAGAGFAVKGVGLSSTVQISFISVDATSHDYFFSFTYQII